MLNIRALRRHHGMTLVELALQAGVPARTLGAIEHGLRVLDPDTAARLATIFGIAPGRLAAHTPEQPTTHARRERLGRALMALLIGSLLITPAPLSSARPRRAATSGAPLAASAARAAPAPRATPAGLQRLLAPSSPAHPSRLAASRPTATAAPTSTPAPAPVFWLADDGPHGCPLVAQGAQIVITQGYGEGTHAPAETWGALDLAIDGDGDGQAEPGATDGRLVVATHDGIAHLFPDSWPGGNMIVLEHPTSSWSTAYAHLSDFAVADGQAVSAGAPLGTVGSTGSATGPHLHYEVRHGGANLDPSGLIACGQR